MKIKKRIIEIEVNDEFITGSGVVIGAAGSHNDVVMKVRFNSSWAGLDIIATFRDALGENPISVVLTALSTLVADESDGDHCVHKFSVPLKAKAYEGKISLSFTGYTVAAVASEDGEGVEYQETQAITSGTAYFNVLKSDAVLADDIFKTADVGQQLHKDVDTLGGMYGYLEGALEALNKLLGQFSTPSFTILDLSEVTKAIENINDFLKHDETEKEKTDNVFLRTYPIGSIYMSVNATDPASLFGGSWVRLKDRFLLGAGDYSDEYGTEGGEASVSLTASQMPSHNHAQRISATTINAVAMVAPKTSGNRSGRTISAESYTSYHEGAAIVKTEDNGSGAAHNNMPPYLAVYMWKREA